MTATLLDTGAGSSYASSTLLDELQLRPIRQEFKRIEMMFGTSNKAINIYGLQIRSLDGKFSLQAEVNKVDHKELLTLENPKCTEMVEQFSYLRGVTIQDDSEKPMLPMARSHYAKFCLVCKKICQREAISSANDFLHPPKFLQALRNFKDSIH